MTPAKGEGTRKYDRTALEMFGRFFGRDRKPATLSRRDWDRFIRARRAGTVGPSGKIRVRQDDRAGLEVAAGGPQLGRPVEGRGGKRASSTRTL